MIISSYIHPRRTFLPCSGVGRHINNVLLQLNEIEDVELELLFSKEFLIENKLPKNAPLRDLPFKTTKSSERLLEWSWKLFSWPQIEKIVDKVDWVYAPMDTLIPSLGINTAITIHDIQAFETDLPWSSTGAHKRFRRRWSYWLAKALTKTNIVFTVSEFSKKRIIEEFALDEAKVRVSGNAVDPEFIKLTTEVDAKKMDYPYCVVIGGLRTKKGGSEILSVANRIAKSWPEVQIVCIGENEPNLVEYSRECSNLHVINMISDEEMVAWIKGAHASLFLSWYEGFGLPVLESMACNTPVICSNKASLPEIAQDSALLVDPQNTHQIEDYIIQLKINKSRQEIINKGEKRFRDFSWEQVAGNVFSTLKEY